jgi:hypothetical protein
MYTSESTQKILLSYTVKDLKMRLQLNKAMDTIEESESSDEDIEWINLPAQIPEVISTSISPTSATTPIAPVN